MLQRVMAPLVAADVSVGAQVILTMGKGGEDMRAFTVHGWTVRLMAVVGVLCAAAFCGCESEDTDSDITATRFAVDQDLVSYSSVDNFTWDTTLNQALATVRIKDFTHGDATLRVFDANGKVLLTKLLATPDNTVYVGGNDFVLSAKTAIGTPGKWRVELGYDEFTGDISIVME